MPERTVTVGSKSGLHARPAKLFVQAAAKQPVKVTIQRGNGRCDARSMLGVLSLGVNTGAHGHPGGRGGGRRRRARHPGDAARERPRRGDAGRCLSCCGVTGSAPARRSGRWCGCRTLSPSRRRARRPPTPTPTWPGSGRPWTWSPRTCGPAPARLDGETKEVLEATAMMASDPELADLAENAVASRASRRPRAVWDAANTFRDLARRRRRVRRRRGRATSKTSATASSAELLGVPAPGIPDPGHPFILVARDLAPADTATIDPQRVLAFVTAEGGPTSHTAILARALGIPAVVVVPGGAGDRGGHRPRARRGDRRGRPRPLTRRPATAAGDARGPRRGPRPALRRPGRHRRRASGRAARQHRRRGGRPGRGRRGSRGRRAVPHRVPVPRPRRRAVGVGADRALRGRVRRVRRARKVVVRTLDAGADKPLPFLDQGEEANPALGVRGLRIGRAQPEVLDTQLARDRGGRRSDRGRRLGDGADGRRRRRGRRRSPRHAREAGLRTGRGDGRDPGRRAVAPARCSARSTSSASAPTTSRSTRFAADRMSGPLAALNDPWQPALLGSSAWSAPPARPGQTGRRLRRGGRRPGARAGAGRARCDQPVDVGTIPVRRGRRAQDGDAAAVPGPGRARGRGRGRRLPGGPPYGPRLPALEELGL